MVALAAAVERDGTVVRFLAYTGLRWSEMAALCVQDFDMLRRRVNVSHACRAGNDRERWRPVRCFPVSALVDGLVSHLREIRSPATGPRQRAKVPIIVVVMGRSRSRRT
jgi:integrase